MKTKKFPPIGAELVRAWTGASVCVILLNNYLDEEGKHCCAVVVSDQNVHEKGAKFLHSHLDMEEILEVLENPGNAAL